MKSTKKLPKPPTHKEYKIASNRLQSLGERIKYLRVHQDPYMTQEQLTQVARIDNRLVRELEQGKDKNIQIYTLRKIAKALGCKLYISIRTKPSRAVGECQLEGPEWLNPPERSRKISAQARWRAEEYRRSFRKMALQNKRPSSQKETSDTDD